jgi:transcriptional regulator with XRE-family HTH domain
MVDTDQRRQRLGAFLRAHRTRLTPEEVGISANGRRRTPGLRREEVAQLAGISATWYVRIEQGREVSASAGALDRIARALRLTAAERAHLFTLADRHDPASGTQGGGEDRLEALQASVMIISAPAYIVDRRWNMRGCNPQAAHLFGPWLYKPGANLLRFAFLDPAARDFLVGWKDRARRLVAECRAELVRQHDDPQMIALISELRSESPEFAALWEEQNVLDPEGGERHFLHPKDGLLAFEQIVFLPAAAPGFRLILLLPERAGDH